MSMLTNIEELTNSFYSLTCKQTEILEFGSVEQLDKNISERQSIIDSIDAINREVGNLLNTYKHIELETTSDDPQIRQLALIRERIREKLNQTRGINEKNEKMAYEKRDELRAEAARVSMSHKSIRAYNQDMTIAEPVYYDKKE